jgi:hypothetical protein
MGTKNTRKFGRPKKMARGFEDWKRDEVVLPLVQHVKNTEYYTRCYAFPDDNNDDDDKAEQKLNARVYV